MKPAGALRTLFMLSLPLAFHMECVRLPVAMGGGTDVSNAKVSGIIVRSDGTMAAKTEVKIIVSSYDPLRDGAVADSLVDTTDSAGAYSFARVDSGSYNIQASNSNDRTSALVVGTHVAGDSVEIPVATLHRPGALEVRLPENVDTVNGYVYVPGTMIGARLNGSASFVILGEVPAGKIPPIRYTVTNNAGPARNISDTIQVPSAGMMTIIYSAFKYSKKLFLNTGSDGANISGNVYDFPVLIRLNKSNFDFSQSQGNGNDIRFIKPDNTSLPYEIERWNAARGLAEIWVKVDTIHGNGNVNAINMYWGNAATTGASNGAAVFDTADGFAAVLHLSNGCGDATINNNAGKNFGTIDTEGMIGNSKKFNGADSIQISGLLGSPKSVTLSAWAQLDMRSAQGAEVISIGDATGIRMDDSRSGFGTEGTFHVSTINTDTTFVSVISNKNLAKTGWHFVVFTFDDVNRLQSLYIDGQQSGPINNNAPISYSGVGINTLIGKHGNGKNNYNFIGRIDEVRVSKTVLSTDWITLCYMNQKAQDQLVMFK
jgi:hypothetical protein